MQILFGGNGAAHLPFPSPVGKTTLLQVTAGHRPAIDFIVTPSWSWSYQTIQEEPEEQPRQGIWQAG